MFKRLLTLLVVVVITVTGTLCSPSIMTAEAKTEAEWQKEFDEYQSNMAKIIEDLQKQLNATPTPKPILPKIKVQEPTVITLKDTSWRTSQVTLKNIGTGQASNILVQLEIPTTTPMIVYFTEDTNYIKSIRAGQTADVKLKFEPDSNAAPGIYPITLMYTYIDEENKEITDKDTVYIKLDTAAGASNVILYKFNSDKQIIQAGDNFTLEAFLENTGNDTVTDVQVVIDGLESNGIYLTDSVGSHYFRDMPVKGTKNVSFGLKASDKAKSGTYKLTFTVAYKDAKGEQKENTYSYYAAVSRTGETSDTAQIKTGQITYPVSQLLVGTDFNVIIPITNTGKMASPAVTITASAGTEGALVPKSADTIAINGLEPGQTENVTFTFAATSKAETRNYAIGFTISYETGAETDEGLTETKSFSQYAGVNISNPEADKKEDEKKSVPKIIISRYESDPIVVKAGQNFDLTIAFKNTHSQRTIKNVKASLSALNETEKKGNVFTPVGASNTFYIDEITPKAEVEEFLTFYTVPDADPRNYIINVNFEYEDEDGNEYKSTEEFGINVKQVTKLETSDINIAPDGFVGQPISVYFDFFNTGKVTLSNLMIKMEGEFNMANTSSYYSNFQPGYSEMYDAVFIPNEPGQKNGKIIISYEDDSGEKIEDIVEFSVNVAEMDMGMGGMPDQGFDMMPMEPEKGIVGKVLDFIKRPVFIISASATVVVLGLIIFFVIRKVRKKRKDMDLDE